MTKEEIKEAEKVGTQLLQTILDLKKLNKEQIKYLELKFQKSFIELDLLKLTKGQ